MNKCFEQLIKLQEDSSHRASSSTGKENEDMTNSPMMEDSQGNGGTTTFLGSCHDF